MERTNTMPETALDSYIAWISDLAVQGRLSDPGDKVVREVARARTLALLRLSENTSKSILLKFLYEAGLIGNLGGEKVPPLIMLNGADLKGVDCSHYHMSHASIISAFLNNANFTGAFLYRVNFNACDLINADLSYATLDGANLLMADLTGANLEGAKLHGTIISDEQLAQAACIRDIER